MFVPDDLRTNAYRVLRLSANATLSEIHRAADSMRRTAKLGLACTNEADIPLSGEVPRSEADIRGAIGRLVNPTQRLNDRLFWFHKPRQPRRNAHAPVLATEAAARRHDEALNRLFVAFEAGLDDSGVALWVQALQVWHTVVSDDDYWALVLDLEERGGFEPVALPSDLDALRDDAVRLITFMRIRDHVRCDSAGRPVAADFDLGVMAEALEGYSASDIRFLVDEAARDALRTAQDITHESFRSAMARVQPSVTPQIEAQYRSIEQRGF